MKHSSFLLFRGTPALLGGAANPYVSWARNGWPSSTGSFWITDTTIRSPVDEKWGPTRYGGDDIPTMAQFISAFNDGHPTIEPLFHPKLTHKQKICRLYKRALREVYSKMDRIKDTHGVAGYYCRQVRAEFEKHRDADPGSAEWYFVRAVNHIEHSKQSIYYGQDHFPGRTSYSRYSRTPHPDEFWTFPHGFDPTESYKLVNPYHRYGIPFLGRALGQMYPHSFMMKPTYSSKPYMARKIMQLSIASVQFVVFLVVLTIVTTGEMMPGVIEKDMGNTQNRVVPTARHV